MARNIHQRRAKNRKAVSATKLSVPVVEETELVPDSAHVTATSTVKHYVAARKGAISQEVMDARVAELPWELKRIALFSAGVVVLLIVLWFFLH